MFCESVNGKSQFIKIDHIMRSDSTMPIELAAFESRTDVLWLDDFTGQTANGWIVKPKKPYAEDEIATITSPEFEVKHDYINFRFEFKTVDRLNQPALFKKVDPLNQLAPMSANLITEDGTIVNIAAVSNDWRCWDASKLKGKKVRIQIVDFVGDNIALNLVVSGRVGQSPTFEKGMGVTLLKPCDKVKDIVSYYMNDFIPGSEIISKVNFISKYDEEYRPQYHYSPDNAYCGDPDGLFLL